MVIWWLCLLLCLLTFVGGIGVGYLIFYKRAYAAGEEAREKEIFTDYVVYMHTDDVEELIRDMRDDDDDDVPIMIIRPDKFDYIDGYESDIRKIIK